MQITTEIVDTTEAAQILGVSRSTVTRLAKDGKLEAYKLTPAPNSPYRITRASIQSLLEQRQPDEKEAAAQAGTAA